MKLLIEGYQYRNHKPGSLEYKTLQGLVNDIELESNNSVSVSYVGYFYSKACEDVVFCLPKVVLTGGKNDGAPETVFGVSPTALIDFEILTDDDIKGKEKGKIIEIKHFLSELAIWIYRTITMYHVNYPDSQILKTEQYNTNSGGKKSKFHTLFDIIIALRDFNKENQNYFSFIARNQHSGNNKIQWSQTISKSQAIVQNGVPTYLNPVNKKKEINFDEELFVIYFSILKYVQQNYGFRFNTDLNYSLIEGVNFEAYRKGKGVRRLKAIKYKYFSDKDLRMWHLCYAFFDVTHSIAINMARQDFMLVDDFQIVFERVIDDLLGDKVYDKNAKNQTDGKNIDHLYKGQSILSQNKDTQTYYIADSKYYKRSERATTEGDTEKYTALHGTSIPKQFTYARNLIQWNLDLFLKDNKPEKEIQLRPDELTEGYNVIPNFFISAFIPTEEGKKFDFKFEGVNQQNQIDFSRQFENRLFDRDTLLLCHYDVNFLFIVSLYGRNNKSSQNAWKTKVRSEFRCRIQKTLDELYEFYILTPKLGQNCYQFVKDNFYKLNGKLFRPKADSTCLILALQKDDALKKYSTLKKMFEGSKQGLQQEINSKEDVKTALCGYFEGTDTAYELKDDTLSKAFIEAESKTDRGTLDKPNEEVLNLYNEEVLIMRVKNQNQLDWINKNHFYNIPLQKFNTKFLSCRALVLVLGKESFLYYITQEKHEVKSKVDLQSMGYVNPHSENYFLLHLDESKQSQRVQVNEPLYKNDYMIIDSNEITLINVEGKV
ncbi:MAG: LlaJI family restriction endonuclease [Bacteroidales bacterium]|nr:LlaJI family restriction endonuclease [Bacteroidales bacterium]